MLTGFVGEIDWAQGRSQDIIILTNFKCILYVLLLCMNLHNLQFNEVNYFKKCR